ncbi:MAG: hypothetical protein RJA98_169 [Pseudomonadota bacterium]
MTATAFLVRRHALHLGGLLPALLLAVTAHAADPAGPVISVPTAVVQSGLAQGGFVLEGTVQAVKQATVAVPTSGRVTQLLVKAGDRVKAGQLLASVDDRDAAAAQSRSEAQVAQADAELSQARSSVERTRSLRQQGFVSQAALDAAEAQFRAVSAGQRAAVAGRTQSGVARSLSSATAPFDGIVASTQVEVGDLAVPGRPLLTMYAPQALRVVVYVPSSRQAVAQAASSVMLGLPGGRWVAPAARSVLPTADAVSQTVEWRLDVSAAEAAALSPGQPVQVRFAAAPSSTGAQGSALTVPASALLQRGELTAVYVAAPGDAAFVLRAVRRGALAAGDAGRVEVLAGLKAGERVALDPVQAGLAGARPAAAR